MRATTPNTPESLTHSKDNKHSRLIKELIPDFIRDLKEAHRLIADEVKKGNHFKTHRND